MRQTLILLCLLVFITDGCKKNNPVNPVILENPVGTWELFSDYIGDSTYLSSEYPCLKFSEIIVNQDSTCITKFLGDSSCYVLRTPSLSISIGTPGLDLTGIWHQAGDSLFLRDSLGAFAGLLSAVNGTEQLTFFTSSTNGAQNFTNIAIFTK